MFYFCPAVLLVDLHVCRYVRLSNGIAQYLDNQPSLFSGNGFAYLIADTITTNRMEGVLGPWLIDHPSVSGPLFLFGGLIELVAVVGLLRPEIHRLWGLIYASLHLITIVTLQVWYLEQVFPAIVILIMSPFCCIKANATIGERLLMLPGVNLLCRLARSRSTALRPLTGA